MPTALVPDDLLDRQAAASRAATDALVQIMDAQRMLFAAALEISRTSVEAITHLSHSMISTALDVSDRATSAASRSAELIGQSVAPAELERLTATGSPRSRSGKERAAA
jgi:hypothetical protein